MYINKINNTPIDTLILGCTHYPILLDTIQNIISNNITIIDSGLSISKQLQMIITKNDQKTLDNKRETKYFVSDVPYRFNELASKFLKYKISGVKQIELI